MQILKQVSINKTLPTPKNQNVRIVRVHPKLIGIISK
jgi:hypothetical protein